MYYQYWGLDRKPFDNVPDPAMYFKMHPSVENAVAELLFAIEEAEECLAVMVGEVGLGKTMALRVVLDALDHSKYRIAFVTNPDITFPQLLREIIGQLKGEPCLINKKVELLEEFNRILFETADSGSKVLVFIDEGNAMKGPNLESLRLLTNMQEDTRNLFTLILAGQPKLSRMLEDPRRENLFQRVGVYCRLEPISSWELVRDYVEHRLERAGCTRRIFTDEALEAIHEHSKGIPRLVNKFCKLSLKAGETNELEMVTAELVHDIALRFERAVEARAKKRAPIPQESREEASALKEALEPSAVDALPPQFEKEPVAPIGSGLAEVASTAPERAEISVERLEQKTLVPITQETTEPHSKEEPKPRISLWAIPFEALEKIRQFEDDRQRLRAAGQVAAQELRIHPEALSDVKDPIDRWKKLRAEILNALRG